MLSPMDVHREEWRKCCHLWMSTGRNGGNAVTYECPHRRAVEMLSPYGCPPAGVTEVLSPMDVRTDARSKCCHPRTSDHLRTGGNGVAYVCPLRQRIATHLSTKSRNPRMNNPDTEGRCERPTRSKRRNLFQMRHTDLLLHD